MLTFVDNTFRAFYKNNLRKLCSYNVSQCLASSISSFSLRFLFLFSSFPLLLSSFDFRRLVLSAMLLFTKIYRWPNSSFIKCKRQLNCGIVLAKMAASLRLGFRRFVVRNNLRSVAALHCSVRSYASPDKVTHTGQVVQGLIGINETENYEQEVQFRLTFSNIISILNFLYSHELVALGFN